MIPTRLFRIVFGDTTPEWCLVTRPQNNCVKGVYALRRSLSDQNVLQWSPHTVLALACHWPHASLTLPLHRLICCLMEWMRSARNLAHTAWHAPCPLAKNANVKLQPVKKKTSANEKGKIKRKHKRPCLWARTHSYIRQERRWHLKSLDAIHSEAKPKLQKYSKYKN